ncbi:MAG: CDP-diacylglycerol--glycerol-3-phosphate 3-phosphatidyltransferase [Planctomycetia bacterium]|nr:CDP-diacylglycerol--glycerol-3-phosphate 3-phosphatidyltransferase [Planctomycetia bacterium]
MSAPDGLDRVWTVPNVLSGLRLVVAVGCFVAIERGAFPWALGLFLTAALTDWVDGWWARTFDQISRLGRIFDPLVDKVLVCGAFVLLAGRGGESAIAPWMAVVVVVRELVVTAVRAEMERLGHDFSAGLSGKLKMVLQCAAVVLELAARTWPGADCGGPATRWLATGTAWAAVAATAWSGAEYLVVAARRLDG